MLLAHITLSDKAFMGSVTHADNARDTVTMARILFGEAAIQETPGKPALRHKMDRLDVRWVDCFAGDRFSQLAHCHDC